MIILFIPQPAAMEETGGMEFILVPIGSAKALNGLRESYFCFALGILVHSASHAFSDWRGNKDKISPVLGLVGRGLGVALLACALYKVPK